MANSEKELLTRLEQVIDWYAVTNGKPKSRAMTTAIDALTRRKVEIDSAPREEPLTPRPAA